MRVFLDGRDIRSLGIGDIQTGEYKKYAADPGEYLASLDAFLQNCGKSIDSIEELHIMKGKGSATALRSSLAIANTIQFVKQIPIYAYSANQEDEVFEQIYRGAMVGILADGYVMPEYSAGPRITKTNKDQLNRKIS